MNKIMNVLIACEESQRVCEAFRIKGHNAFSCDILDCSGGHPEWHIKTNVLNLLDLDLWDMIIAFPPCTDLAVSGARWFKYKQINGIQQKIIEFFMKFVNCNCHKIAIENPVGIMSSIYRKPDQIIQPYYFGDYARKKTCLWLKNLPLLKPNNIVDPGIINSYGQSIGSYSDGKGINNKWFRYNDPELKKLRSKTFPGIAHAMADQWG